MSTDDNTNQSGELEPKFQRRVVGIGLFIVAVLIASLVLVIYAGMTWNEGEITHSWQLLYLAVLGGTFGGSARSLFMLISEIGIHRERSKTPVAAYLSRWFLYLMKPFVGGASGVLFFLALNFGLVRSLTDASPNLRILPVFFVSAVGGIFFEEVFAVLNGLLNTLSSQNKSNVEVQDDLQGK